MNIHANARFRLALCTLVATVSAVLCGVLGVVRTAMGMTESVGWVYTVVATISLAAMVLALAECARLPRVNSGG